MKVNDIKTSGLDRAKSVQSVGDSTSAEVSSKAAGSPDRVSVGGSRAIDEAIFAARKTQDNQRATRLERIEAAVRSGEFLPNAARVAEQIMADAEVEARLQAMLRR